MSSDAKRPHAEALESSRRFADLFGATFKRWTVAGSVRRKRPMCGDVEHVVEPHMSGPKGDRNAVWDRLDSLMPVEGIFATPSPVGFTKAVYPGGSHRWGPKYRGVMFEGWRHEIFMADADNWGSVLAIRTGPAEFSHKLQVALQRGGQFVQDEGYLRESKGGPIVPMPTERDYLAACRVPWIEPEDRR